MTAFAEKLRDPLWIQRRDELLEAAGGLCQDFGVSGEIQVHICFWEKGREPRGLPDEAYRCLYVAHRELRTRLEEFIRRTLAAFTADELDSLANAVECVVRMAGGRSVAMERIYIAAKQALEAERYSGG